MEIISPVAKILLLQKTIYPRRKSIHVFMFYARGDAVEMNMDILIVDI